MRGLLRLSGGCRPRSRREVSEQESLLLLAALLDEIESERDDSPVFTARVGGRLAIHYLPPVLLIV